MPIYPMPPEQKIGVLPCDKVNDDEEDTEHVSLISISDHLN
jgi:hypothetical protein